jgi:hypothetical protein
MSDLFKINLLDLGKGLLVAAIAAIGTALLPILESGALPTLANLQAAGIAGLTAGIAYLLKNLFTNSSGTLLKKE